MHYRFESAPFFELIPESMNTENRLVAGLSLVNQDCQEQSVND